MSKKPEDFLIWQYRGKPKARRTLQLLTDETKRSFASALKLAEILDIQKSAGYGLDLVGRHTGTGRTLKSFSPKDYFGWAGVEGAQGFNAGGFYRYGDSLQDPSKLGDEDYRFFIKARIIKNYQHPTLSGVTYSVRSLLGSQSFVIDNYDMTMNIVIPDTELTPFRLYAIKQLDILSRPAGVRYKYLVINDARPFGWAQDNQAFGFGNGKFTRILNVSR